MLIKDLKGNTKPFEAYNELTIEQEINNLDIITFLVPKAYTQEFKNEYVVDTGEQFYTVKNIEPYYDDYLIEGRQDISEWQEFHRSLNFPYKNINTVINGIMPVGWKLVLLDDITEKRTITADHKTSIEVIEEIKKKYGVEVRFDNRSKKIYVGYEISKDKGTYFAENINLMEKDIKMESFEFATRIVPEGMNGLKINQINNGLDYLEDKSYSDKTITYYWKDERYTNIQNLKNDAQKKLDELSKPYVTIATKVQDLSRAVGVYNLDLNLGDYVHLLDNENLTNDKYRIVKIKKIDNDPFNTEVTLNNKLIDLIDDEDRIINLTNEMWENTRTRFEVTENSIKGFVESQKRYTDDSFKTYRSEREQTDKRIYEAITESTTYVDPVTGQTKPIIDKQLEIDKSLDGIKIDLVNLEKANQENIDVSFDKIKEEMEGKFAEVDTSITNVKGDVIAYKQAFDIANGKVNAEIVSLRQEIDNSGDDIKKFITKNYSTRTQTDTMISDKIGTIKSQMDLADTNLKKYVEENYSTRTQTKETIEDSLRSVKLDISNSADSVKKYVSENYSTRKQTQQAITDSIKSVENKIDTTESGLRDYVQENYSTRTQTQEQISDTVKTIKTDVQSEINKSSESVKTYVTENYTSKTQTDEMIKTEVSSIKTDVTNANSKAERAYSTAIQTTEELSKKVSKGELSTEVRQLNSEISTKVGTRDVYSIMQQLPSYVKIDAKNIDLTGDVDVQGTFKTSSYGKRVEIIGNSIKFYDWGSFKGSLTIDDENIISLNGSNGYDTGYISMNKNLAKAPFRYLNSFYPNCWLGGDWGVVNLESGEIRTIRLGVDRMFESYGLSTFYKNAIFKDKIILDNMADIRTTSGGGQVWITQTSSGLSFVIDYASKRTYFA